ncbi:MAG TPA: hypothetical protein PLZ79_13565, partial [Burkholderiales bacterium]|nr:hypothetical protein [Burkholderiales bacterium]
MGHIIGAGRVVEKPVPLHDRRRSARVRLDYARWCVVTRQTTETREGRSRLAHAVLDQRERIPPRQAPKHRVAGPTWHRETGLRERGVKSL